MQGRHTAPVIDAATTSEAHALAYVISQLQSAGNRAFRAKRYTGVPTSSGRPNSSGLASQLADCGVGSLVGGVVTTQMLVWFTEALRLYGEAIAGGPSNAVLLCNRSAAAAAAGDRALALADARAAIGLRPDWAKAHFRHDLPVRHCLGCQLHDTHWNPHCLVPAHVLCGYLHWGGRWRRLGGALAALHQWPEAAGALAAGLRLDPGNPEVCLPDHLLLLLLRWHGMLRAAGCMVKGQGRSGHVCRSQQQAWRPKGGPGTRAPVAQRT